MQQKQIHFIRSSADETKALAAELVNCGIPIKYIHVFGRDQVKLRKVHLVIANILETSDLLPAFWRGLFFGAIVGVLFGSAMVFWIFVEFNLGLRSFLVLLLFCALFGGWVASMVGIGIPSKVVEQFEKELEQGKYLILVTVPLERVDELYKKFPMQLQ